MDAKGKEKLEELKRLNAQVRIGGKVRTVGSGLSHGPRGRSTD